MCHGVGKIKHLGQENIRTVYTKHISVLSLVV